MLDDIKNLFAKDAKNSTETGESQEDERGNRVVEENKTNASLSPSKKNRKDYPHKRPGRLRGNIVLSLHTFQAQRLFNGYKDKRAVGLVPFGGAMTQVWDAAEQDDPYADFYLLKVYDQFSQLKSSLQEAISQCKSELNNANAQSNLEFSAFVSQKPVNYELWFRTQYGYLGAQLLANLDELMRVLITAERVGVLLSEPYDVLRKRWVKRLLDFFALPFSWEKSGLDRKTIMSDDEDTRAIIKKLDEKIGQLPQSVLAGTIRSPFAPRIRTVTATSKMLQGEDKVVLGSEGESEKSNLEIKPKEKIKPAKKIKQADQELKKEK